MGSTETFHTLSTTQAARLPKATPEKDSTPSPLSPSGELSRECRAESIPGSNTCWCYSPSPRGTALTYSLLRHMSLLLSTEVPKV